MWKYREFDHYPSCGISETEFCVALDFFRLPGLFVRKILVLISALFAAFLFFTVRALADEAKKTESPAQIQLRLGDLKFTAEEKGGPDEYSLKYSIDGEIVFQSECAFKIREPRIIPDLPRPNCRSLLAYCFSGGAHCCLTLLIATDCGAKTSLNSVDLAHSDADIKLVKAGRKEGSLIKVIDWQFAYYSVENSELELSFADSPGMTRLLVFDGDRWRADRVGEFSAFYSGLLKKSLNSAQKASRRGKETESRVGKAITTAYYALMAGKSTEDAAKILNRFLPPDWRLQSGRILEDIRQAVSGFNPVEVIR